MNIEKNTTVMVFSPRINEKRKNTVTAQVSSFEGKDKYGKSKYCYWYTHFVGDAYEKAKLLKEKDIIVINNANVENAYSRETGKTYVTLAVFNFHMKNESQDKNQYYDDEEYIDYALDEDVIYFKDDETITKEEFDEGDTYTREQDFKY